MEKAEWKVIAVFQATCDTDTRNAKRDQEITVVKIYPINTDYCGDPFDLLLPLEDLKFWERCVGKTFTVKGDPDLSRLTPDQLKKLPKLSFIFR